MRNPVALILMLIPSLCPVFGSYSIPRIPASSERSVADWQDQGLELAVLTSTEHDGGETSPSGLAKARLGWNDEGLLVYLQVSDADRNEVKGDKLYRGDSVELFLAPKVTSEDCLQLIVAPGIPGTKLDSVRSVVIGHGAVQSAQAKPVVLGEATEDGYWLQICLPWSAIGVAPELGRDIGFQLVVNDLNQPYPAPAEPVLHHLSWFPDRTTSNNKAAMHRLTLGTEPSPPVDSSVSILSYPLPPRLLYSTVSGMSGKQAEAYQDGRSLGKATLKERPESALAVAEIPLEGLEVGGPDLEIKVEGQTAAHMPAPKVPDPGSGKPLIINDIVYAEASGQELKLDLYLPVGVENPPLLVFIHGGGWRSGTRKKASASWLTEHGYAVASIDYRLSQVAPFPAQIHDVKGAVRWLRAHQEALGYDASQITVIGSSAGGYLAVLLGVTAGDAALEGETGGNLDQSSEVQAIIDYFGPVDFIQRSQSQPAQTEKPNGKVYRLLGGPVSKNQELAKQASPAFHVDETSPPILIIHGTADTTVLPAQSERLVEVYREHGRAVEYYTIEGAGHGGAIYQEPPHREPVIRFLKEQYAPRTAEP